MADSDDKKISVVVLGAGPSMAGQIASMISRLDQVMIVDRPQEQIVYEIHARQPCVLPNIFLRQEHGAYRQFEKHNKRDNFQRATSRNFRKL